MRGQLPSATLQSPVGRVARQPAGARLSRAPDPCWKIVSWFPVIFGGFVGEGPGRRGLLRQLQISYFECNFECNRVQSDPISLFADTTSSADSCTVTYYYSMTYSWPTAGREQQRSCGLSLIIRAYFTHNLLILQDLVDVLECGVLSQEPLRPVRVKNH